MQANRYRQPTQQAVTTQTMLRMILGITVLGAFMLQAAYPAQAIWLSLYVGIAGIIWAGSGLWESREVLFKESFKDGLSLPTRVLATAGWLMAAAGGVWIIYMSVAIARA